MCYLCRTACLFGSECAWLLSGGKLCFLWPATFFLTIFFPSAVALFAFFHHAIAAKSLFRF